MANCRFCGASLDKHWNCPNGCVGISEDEEQRLEGKFVIQDDTFGFIMNGEDERPLVYDTTEKAYEEILGWFSQQENTKSFTIGTLEPPFGEFNELRTVLRSEEEDKDDQEMNYADRLRKHLETILPPNEYAVSDEMSDYTLIDHYGHLLDEDDQEFFDDEGDDDQDAYGDDTPDRDDYDSTNPFNKLARHENTPTLGEEEDDMGDYDE